MSKVEQAFCRSAPWRHFARRVALPWSLSDLQPAGRVLEIGAGSGAMAAAVLDRFPGVTYVATDPDPAMVDAAAKRLAPYGERVSVIRADATALDFPPSSFDTVLSFIMLHHVIEWERALREVARVLRPGGTFVGYDLLSNPLSRAIHALDGSPHRLLRSDELRAELASLGIDAVVQTVGGAFAMRFAATMPVAADAGACLRPFSEIAMTDR